MKLGKFFGVGVGPGDPGLITVKAVEILKSADVIFTVTSRQSARTVSGAVIDSVEGIAGKQKSLIFAMTKEWEDRMNLIRENTQIILEDLKLGKDCVFATIGDPLTYSTYGYLIKELLKAEPELAIKTIPGVNSWSALAAESNTVLVEDKEKLCIVPSYSEVSEKDALRHADTVVFLKTYKSRDTIVNNLKEDIPEASLLYGANIGMDEQFISTDCDEIIARDQEYMSMLIVKKNEEL